jgi:hypothetical protein
MMSAEIRGCSHTTNENSLCTACLMDCIEDLAKDGAVERQTVLEVALKMNEVVDALARFTVVIERLQRKMAVIEDHFGRLA